MRVLIALTALGWIPVCSAEPFPIREETSDHAYLGIFLLVRGEFEADAIQNRCTLKFAELPGKEIVKVVFAERSSLFINEEDPHTPLAALLDIHAKASSSSAFAALCFRSPVQTTLCYRCGSTTHGSSITLASPCRICSTPAIHAAKKSSLPVGKFVA